MAAHSPQLFRRVSFTIGIHCDNASLFGTAIAMPHCKSKSLVVALNIECNILVIFDEPDAAKTNLVGNQVHFCCAPSIVFIYFGTFRYLLGSYLFTRNVYFSCSSVGCLGSFFLLLLLPPQVAYDIIITTINIILYRIRGCHPNSMPLLLFAINPCFCKCFLIVAILSIIMLISKLINAN